MPNSSFAHRHLGISNSAHWEKGLHTGYDSKKSILTVKHSTEMGAPYRAVALTTVLGYYTLSKET